MTSSLAAKIALLSGYGASSDGPSIAQAQYRIDLVSKWSSYIKPGARVLELGCGQGDTTLVLAEAVGENGHVDAVDPGPLDYGSPKTLGQAHDTVSAGPLGQRISWVHASPLAFLAENPTKKWDAVVLSHCLWYFSSPSLITDTLRTLAKHTKAICIAEWSLESGSRAEALPHVLAAMTQGALECHKPVGESAVNIRTLVSPAQIVQLAADAGLRVVVDSEARVVPGVDVHDGRWEVGHVLTERFAQEVQQFVGDEREKGFVYALRDAVRANAPNGVKAVASMDGWVVVFEPVDV
ncbi:SAM-dependent methyltransferase-like protein [Roridomyces roridus]|uniref:SAM-dependent methyltransferase-like protein n=1 Tax=Roridomyces roridus TaxID=1738132 RepID=A0AAD7FLN5_9AGAR|nr:SAM-dependent methyltransferase-like protein [Roridomyces roridus]